MLFIRDYEKLRRYCIKFGNDSAMGENMLDNHLSKYIEDLSENVDFYNWYKKQELPNKLYKYRSFNQYSKDNIENNTLYYSNPLNFNDPYDCSCDFQQKEIEDENGIVFVDKDIIITAIKDNLRICSLSERNDSLPMWAHYSDNHQGICIEYDLTDIDDKTMLSYLYPMFYTNDLIKITANFAKKHMFFISNIIAMYKNEDWEYEKEWRFILPFTESFIKDKKFNMVNSTMLSPKISAIYIGSKADYKTEQELRDLIADRDIKLYKMKENSNSYNLIPEELQRGEKR